MPISRVVMRVLRAAAILLSVPVYAAAQHPEQDAKQAAQDVSEQTELTELRAIAEAIQQCPERQTANGDGSSVEVYAPMNVVWDARFQESARSPELGFVEFVERSAYIARALAACRKNDADCERRNQAIRETDAIRSGLRLPDRFRYEFDFGPAGLEFARALEKYELDDDKQWRAMNPGDGCEARAVWAVLGRR